MNFKDLPEKRYVYFLCPVRGVTKEQKGFLDDYVTRLEANGHEVHYPHRDAKQDDPTGFGIVTTHKTEMRKCTELHAYWTGSEGQVFDLGMSGMIDLPVHIIPECNIKRTENKSFTNVIIELEKMYKQQGFVPAQPKQP